VKPQTEAIASAPFRGVQVQLALVVGSPSDARDAATAVKTLVHHRRLAPLRLHVFVNQLTHHIMQTLLRTWQLSQGSVNDLLFHHRGKKMISHKHPLLFSFPFPSLPFPTLSSLPCRPEPFFSRYVIVFIPTS